MQEKLGLIGNIRRLEMFKALLGMLILIIQKINDNTFFGVQKLSNYFKYHKHNKFILFIKSQNWILSKYFLNV